MAQKVCKGCGKDFDPGNYVAGLRFSRDIECANKYMRDYYAGNPEKYAAKLARKRNLYRRARGEEL